jgi:hypothetical protein
VCVSHKASTVNQIKASHLSKCICIGPHPELSVTAAAENFLLQK